MKNRALNIIATIEGENKYMNMVEKINAKLAKIPKFGKLQLFIYPMIAFGLLAMGVAIIALTTYVNIILTS